MRHRRLVASMKAIWALGMISGRSGDLFERGKDFWFEDNGLLAPDDGDPHWPYHLTNSGSIAVGYSEINDLRIRIGHLAQLTHAETDQYPELCAGVDTFLAQRLSWSPRSYLPQIFSSHAAALRHWSSTKTSSKDISTPRELLTYLCYMSAWRTGRQLMPKGDKTESVGRVGHSPEVGAEPEN
ncbi:hypothetical protein DFH06DRAFT_1332400 [Mycena polygramma]|nr:hypothetical protein DFH06DRAFT_1332400 [Mycena polygramma]